MSKKRPRRLWLNIKASGISVSRREFVRALIASIEAGDYELPDGWEVIIEWRNRFSAKMRSGLWQEEMGASAESSDGFDKAVTDWLRRKLK